MAHKARLLFTFLISGLFLLSDRYLKYLAVKTFGADESLSIGFFHWQPSFNHGLAFSLPFPNILIILFTIPVLLLLGYLLYTSDTKTTYLLIPVLLGALSNFYDRLVYHYTIDYFLLITAIINIADIMIVGGFLLYYLKIKFPSKK